MSYPPSLLTAWSLSPFYHCLLLQDTTFSPFWWNFSTKTFFSISVHLQISAGLQKHTCCAVWIFLFLIIGFWQRGGEERFLSNPLHWTMNFLHHLNVSLECLSDSLQQILKYDNGPQKWLMVSFSWFHFPDPLHPLACVPRLIRNQGFSLISWWVSWSALSQICCFHYLSYSWWLLLKLSFFPLLPSPLFWSSALWLQV